MERLYLVFITAGLIINFIANYYGLKNKGIKLKDNICINIIQSIMLVLGCKILHILINYRSYKYADLIETIISGYMFYGGIVLSTLYIYLYCKMKNINIQNVLRVIIPNILLLYSVCKIGCFCNKCCIGINQFPIQLIESISSFSIYIIVQKYCKMSNKIYFSCISFGVIRFAAFLLRDEIDMLNLLVNEIISVIIILFGFFYKSKENI